MAPTFSRRTRLSAVVGAFALVAGLATTIATTQSAQAAPAQGTATYLVQLTDAPAAGYTGGDSGFGDPASEGPQDERAARAWCATART